MSKKHKNIVVACDLDGVVCEFNASFRELILKQTGIELPPISDTYPDEWGYHKKVLTPKQIDNLWREIHNSEFFRNVKPLAETWRLFELLQSGSYDVYFVTNRQGQYAKYQAEQWLMDHGYVHPTVLLAVEKGPVCAGLDVDVFVDDKPENCWDVKDCCPEASVFLVDRPYNRNEMARVVVEECGVIRVSSALDERIWKGAAVSVEDLKKSQMGSMHCCGGSDKHAPGCLSDYPAMLKVDGAAKMQTFATGATRSSSEGKPDYEGFINPLVIQAYGRYMLKHQVQADGQLRASDNWQKGISPEAYAKSFCRHAEDLKLLHRGYPAISPDDGHEITKVEACMAILFNVMGYALEELKQQP